MYSKLCQRCENCNSIVDTRILGANFETSIALSVKFKWNAANLGFGV